MMPARIGNETDEMATGDIKMRFKKHIGDGNRSDYRKRKQRDSLASVRGYFGSISTVTKRQA